MEEGGGGGRYTSNPYRMSQDSGPLRNSLKLQRNTLHGYEEEDDVKVEQGYDDDDDDEEEEEVDGVDEHRVTRPISNRMDTLDDEESDDESDDEGEVVRHQKKRKLKSLLSVAPSTSSQEPSTLDWTEQETSFFLDAWGEKFLDSGRKSLRGEEWQDVAEQVSQESRFERTEAQCRNRLDILRNKYKKEKMKLAERGGGVASKWVHFRKMDYLMSASPPRKTLSCGMDSGEYVFMNPIAYLDLANGMDELRDSPCNSESAEGGDDSEMDDAASIRVLADSIGKFGEIYEKVEHGKRQQLVELENMRMDFQRDLEIRKRQIMERTETEIARIRQGGDDENDLSADNPSE